MPLSDVHILVVEDSATHLEFIRDALAPLGDGLQLSVAGSLAEARAVLAEMTPDLALVDLILPDGKGLELLTGAGEGGSIPVVILTSQGDEGLAVEAMKIGALDYLVKTPETLMELPRTVERALREWGHICGRRRAEEKIRQLAYFDGLTGLPNRIRFLELLQQALGDSADGKGSGALFFLDLDRFKNINDTLGHASGDRLLVETATRLRRCVREQDLVARLGGDEFVVLMSPPAGRSEAAAVADRIMAAMALPVRLGGEEVFTSPSIGIALFPEHARESDPLIKYADLAMYASKEAGRNRFTFFTREMTEKAMQRLKVENRLRRALDRQELSLVYQPQVDTRNGQVTGVEALLRWNSPEGGLLPPGSMIPIAEETGLIHPLWEWSLRTACIQMQAWKEAGLPPVRVSINVPGHKFRDPGMTELVKSVLAETGCDPSLLELELIEGVLMDDAAGTIDTLRALKELGVGLTIDDFGLGCSSLLHLKEFPLDRIKIARQFVGGVPESLPDGAIVRAIVAMTEKLGFAVVAVGVETGGQAAFLAECGCHQLQGFYFSKPLTPQDLQPLLVKGLGSDKLCPFRGRNPSHPSAH